MMFLTHAVRRSIALSTSAPVPITTCRFAHTRAAEGTPRYSTAEARHGNPAPPPVASDIHNRNAIKGTLLAEVRCHVCRGEPPPGFVPNAREIPSSLVDDKSGASPPGAPLICRVPAGARDHPTQGV